VEIPEVAKIPEAVEIPSAAEAPDSVRPESPAGAMPRTGSSSPCSVPG
jgi:hypothetical protein